MKKKRRAGAQRKRRSKKKSHEGGMREAYDSKRERRRKGREGKKSGTSGEIKIVESFFCYRHPRPPDSLIRELFIIHLLK